MMLGGGSVLAARWKHRESSDIDVLLPDRENLVDAMEGGTRELAGPGENDDRRRRETTVLANAQILRGKVVADRAERHARRLRHLSCQRGRRGRAADRRQQPERETGPSRGVQLDAANDDMTSQIAGWRAARSAREVPEAAQPCRVRRGERRGRSPLYGSAGTGDRTRDPRGDAHAGRSGAPGGLQAARQGAPQRGGSRRRRRCG